MTATVVAPKTILQSMGVEVTRFGYAHAIKQSLASSLLGPRHGPIPPLGCSRRQRDAPIPP